MTAALLDGKAIAQKVRDEVRHEVARFVAQHGRAPGLDVVLVGDDPASQVYTRNKEKASIEVGMRGRLHRLAADVGEAAVLELVRGLAEDDAVDGILVQLPCPRASTSSACSTPSPPRRTSTASTRSTPACSRRAARAWSPVHRAAVCASAEAGTKLEGARAVVVGRSNIVGKPIAQLLLAQHATVTIAHSRTRDLAAVCREADVLIAAVGKARMIQGDWIKPGATVIDVGINRTPEGKLCGDVDTDAARERAAWITPCPAGSGR